MIQFILVAMVASIVALIVLKRGEAIRFETTATARQVTLAAVGQVATKKRWQTVSQTEHSVAFTYYKKPRFIVAFLLFLLGFIPGVVYLIIAGKHESLNVSCDDLGNTRLVQITSNGFRGKSAGRQTRTHVGVANGTAAALEGATTQLPPATNQA